MDGGSRLCALRQEWNGMFWMAMALSGQERYGKEGRNGMDGKVS